ncbi:hypothetical protein [Methanobrevibacter sp.]|uniref:hypothetical protein n=1 Tax=Methanobrevibacter sp. TaxID=66852 RepID=UPI00388D033B
MAHPHVKAISEMEDASKLVDIIAESKSCYVRDNLSVHLHDSQIRLIKNIVKHSKPHHRKVRVRQYAKINEDKHFDLHLKLYLKKYKKLERLGLAEILDVEDLPYDVVLTDKGLEIFSQIEALEDEWASKVSCDIEALREMALNSFEYSYKFKKNQKYQF